MSDAHFRRLESLYAIAPCNASLSPTLHVERGQARVQFTVGPDHHHAMRGVHGSFYFKALDDAAFFAANSVVEDAFVLTVSLTVHFLRPITDGVMIADGTLIREGRELLFADSIVRDDRGRELGRSSGVFARSRYAIPPYRDTP